MGAQDPKDATLLFLSSSALSDAARSALEACVGPLGHETAAFAALEDDLELLVHTVDPWSVVAVDDQATAALKAAFGAEASAFALDKPAEVRGYTFVAVPGFQDCLEDRQKKRVAWERLKAAQHPGSPY